MSAETAKTDQELILNAYVFYRAKDNDADQKLSAMNLTDAEKARVRVLAAELDFERVVNDIHWGRNRDR